MNRIQQLQERLECDLLIVDKPVDLFYLTGLQVSKGRLAVSKAEAVLLVDGRYLEVAQKQALCRVMLSEREALREVARGHKRVAIDSAFTSVDEFRLLEKELGELVCVSEPVRALRLIKEKGEIGALRKAAKLTWEGYLHATSRLREGVTEGEIAWEFERYCRERGAMGMSFEPIVAFGENSAYPHHRAGKTVLKNDQVVMIDVGAVVDHYAGDLTRMVFFGKPDRELETMLASVKRAQKDALREVKEGMTVGELDRVAREVFKKEGTEHLFVHNLGHGIGLETHEYPRIRVDGPHASCVIKKGMVFTIEPGLYKPGLGGVRHEDMILVTEKGGESLYQGYAEF